MYKMQQISQIKQRGTAMNIAAYDCDKKGLLVCGKVKYFFGIGAKAEIMF